MTWMTNQTILAVAMEQSAVDSGCSPEDFCSPHNKVVRSLPHPGARKYLELPFACDLTSYGSNIVASVSEPLEGIVWEYISKYPVEHCFETPNLHALMDRLRPLGWNACFMAEYFLPDGSALRPLGCPFETKVLTARDFAPLYLPQWGNALCERRKELDVLGVGAYHNGALIGLAGCSADCDTMYQIGVDVLPPYRRQGVAACLTSALAIEILNRGKAPFYCCAWSNLGSARNAIKSGFRPAWVQLTVKSRQTIEKMNA